MLQLYAYGTFCDIQKRWFAISPPYWHSTTWLRVMIGSLSFFPSLPPPPSPSWVLREMVQAAAATALLSDCHSSISLPLSAHGVQLTTHDPRSQTASSRTAREPSASTDIFQGPFQQMEFLQVPFGVKYLAWGYSIWSITNWIVYPCLTPLHLTSHHHLTLPCLSPSPLCTR